MQFPRFGMRDMVQSQYRLLKRQARLNVAAATEAAPPAAAK